MGKLVINVSGRLFVTTTETIAKYPNTKLGKVAVEKNQGQEIYFDEDEEVFREVLRYYRTGELHVPHNMCRETFHRQLEFWGLTNVELEECCQSYEMSDEELERQLAWFEKRIELNRELTMKDKVWYFLTDPTGPYTRYRKAAIAWTTFYVILVVAQGISNALTTLPKYAEMFMSTPNATYHAAVQMFLETPCEGALRQKQFEEYHQPLPVFPYFCLIFFIVEIAVRLISCPKKKVFVCSINMLDLLIAIAELLQYTFYYAAFYALDFENANEHICLVANVLQLSMYGIVQLRCLRVFTLVMICNELRVLILAISASRKEILLLVTIMGISCLLFGPAIYYLEMIGTLLTEDGVMGIDSVPTGYWWVVVTMTTVGYGDYYPKNAIGYITAAVIMMLGLMITALPIAVVGGNFSVYYEYNKKRNQRLKAEKRRLKETRKYQPTELMEVNDHKFTNDKPELVNYKLQDSGEMEF